MWVLLIAENIFPLTEDRKIGRGGEEEREGKKKKKRASVPLALFFATPVPQCSKTAFCFKITFLDFQEGTSLLQNPLIHKRKKYFS